MATIAQNLQKLVDSKTAIATAITEKGGTVNSGDGFEEFPSDIATIPGGGTPIIPYLTFKGTSTFTLGLSGEKLWDGTIEYSLDKTNWTIWDGSTSLSSNGNNELYLRGSSNKRISSINNVSWSYFVFTTNGTIDCIGRIDVLLDYNKVINCVDITENDIRVYAFRGMFKDCTSLTSAPELPLKRIVAGLYQCMFAGCTSLKYAPKLQATDFVVGGGFSYDPYSCYEEMFYGCTSLKKPPELPAKSVPDSCYEKMFSGCTSLRYAPELPATVLGRSCYSNMFNGCTSLMLSPELPATELNEECYREMFKGCTDLITIPELTATTLTTRCYYYMFDGCSKIKISQSQLGEYQTPYRIPASGTGDSGTNSCYSMFYHTGGDFKSTPVINTTYYTSNTVV